MSASLPLVSPVRLTLAVQSPPDLKAGRLQGRVGRRAELFQLYPLHSIQIAGSVEGRAVPTPDAEDATDHRDERKIKPKLADGIP